MIGLVVMLAVPIAVFGWGATFTQRDVVLLVAVAIGIGAVLYVAIGFIVNTKTITLTDDVLIVKTRPLPLWRTVVLSVNGIIRAQVEKTVRSDSNSKWSEYAVVITHDVVGRETLIKFRDDEPAAIFVLERLVDRLDLGDSGDSS